MRIKLILPYETLLDKEVKKITAPGTEGVFQILPKHVDGTWSLTSGILVLTTEKEEYYAINTGVLVKQGTTVYLSCLQAIPGNSLETLNKTLQENLRVLNEKERKAREVLVRLETDTLKRFMEIDF